jgi:hypothetical protein
LNLFRLFAATLCVLGLIGCHEFDDLTGAPDDLATHIGDGIYTGPLELEMRAYLGPVMVKQGYCDTDIRIKVRSYAKHFLRGDVNCDMDSLGEVSVDVTGDLHEMPTVIGEVKADDMEIGWNGWFYGHDLLYGETSGETFEGNLRIEYWGYFDLQRTKFIDWEYRPENSDQLAEYEARGF